MLDIQSSSAPQFFGLPYLHMVIDEDKIVAFSDRVPVQRKDEPKRDRPINRDPTNADRSLQLISFPDRLWTKPKARSFQIRFALRDHLSGM